MNLEYTIAGAGHDKATLVFVHGWPDDGRLWAPLCERFVAIGYRCVVVTLPAFPTSQHTSGCDFSELAERLHNTIVSTQTDRSEPVISIQYHSEASPGPLDNVYVFDRFVEMMDGVDSG